MTSGRDTNLKGAQLIADRIEGTVGRDLNIESRQDTEIYHSKESSSGMQASICVPPFCYGTTVNASATMANGNTDSTYASVHEQSGIYAGQGGFAVNVKGNTDLKGGILASTADPSKNSLTTGTLTTSDIENKAEYSSSSSQFAASFSAGKSLPDGKDLAGNMVKQGDYMADNLNLVGDLANTAMASAAGNAQKPITGNASGTTKSAIAAGTVTITDANGQQAKTGKTVEETLASLNRDTENANQNIDKIFDAQKVKDEQALRRLTGETIQQAAPIIYNQVGNVLKGQDEYVKVAVHGLVGGLVSKALGGDFGTGAVGVAASTAAIAALDENLGSLGVDPATKDKLLQLVGMAVAGAIGGNAAAGTAGMADAYNRQLHPEESRLIKRLAEEKAQQLCKGDASCMRSATVAWSDLLERVAKGQVDNAANATNMEYLQRLVETANDPKSQGAQGGVAAYLANLKVAQDMLAPYMGKAIIVNGVPVSGEGEVQTYFSATPAQSANPYINYVLGMQPPGPAIPGVEARDQTRLENLAAINGSTKPDSILEEVLIGGAVANRVAGTIGRFVESVDALLAGRAVASSTGNISARQVTEGGMSLPLSVSERTLLSQVSSLPNTTAQGDLSEFVVNNFFARNGYTVLDGKCGSNCFDGVYIRGKTVYINEMKPLKADGSIKLNGPQGSLPTQMTDSWIDQALIKLDSGTAAQKDVAKQIRDAINEGRLVKMATAFDSTGASVTIKLQ